VKPTLPGGIRRRRGGGHVHRDCFDNKSVLSTILSRIGAVVRNGLDTISSAALLLPFTYFPMIGMRRYWPAEQPDLYRIRKTSDLEPAESGYEAADRRPGKPVVAGAAFSALLIIAAASS